MILATGFKSYQEGYFLVGLFIFIAINYKWISGISIFNWTTLILHNIL